MARFLYNLGVILLRFFLLLPFMLPAFACKAVGELAEWLGYFADGISDILPPLKPRACKKDCR